ncbi:MAG: hypothetical protein KGJ93_00615 [Patescibacteria group bacterium]|nr:hypothetical protein [Patescibacteria group bacterium]
MEIIRQYFPNILDIVHIAFTFTVNGGWVLFVIGAIAMFWHSYIHEIQHQYIHAQDWIFLSIKVPRENQVSTLAVESIFAQMHALHVGKTYVEKYVEGHIQLWYSLEIISLGGKISFVVRLPERMKDTVEAAFYSHYPQAEITEISDYMENFHYSPDVPGDYEIFGSEWKLEDSDMVPIKTYKDFEHLSAEQKIIDPLSNFFEGLSKIKPYEFIGYQIIIQPLADNEWHQKADAKIKQLTGEEAAHERTLGGVLSAPFGILGHQSLLETFRKGSHNHGGHGHAEENKPKNNWLNMTETEKERVTLVEKKVGKPGYKTKIRMLYIAPSDKFDNSRKSLMSGLYRPLGSEMRNKLKPDVRTTWTGVDALISKTLEKPYLEWLLKNKKRKLFKGYKQRDVHIGRPMFIFNIEELATLFHFPITAEGQTVHPAIEQTQSKTGRPPANLPVLENEFVS